MTIIIKSTGVTVSLQSEFNKSNFTIINFFITFTVLQLPILTLDYMFGR